MSRTIVNIPEEPVFTLIDIPPEVRERIMNRIITILSRGNNVEIKRRSNGIIAVMEIKAKSYNYQT